MQQNNRWKIWIDTGGTFTDCMAIAPDTGVNRCKILSSGVLKGTITGLNKDGSYEFEHSWPTNNPLTYSGFRLKFSDPSLKDEDFEIDQINLPKNRIKFKSISDINEKSFPVGFEITAHEEAPILASRLITGTELNETLPPMELRLGTTRGTNALLERKGKKPLLVVTKGFADILKIGTQQRPDIFALNIKKPEPYFLESFEIDERTDAKGEIVKPVDRVEIKKLVSFVKDRQIKNVVVSLVNSYKNSQHEKQIEEELEKAGVTFITISSKVEASINYYIRTKTAVINAYLQPVLKSYVEKISEKLHPDSDFRIMTSAGSLEDAGLFNPKDSLLSGPAGGVSGTAVIAKKTGFNKLLAFDMGGTSADVSRYSKGYDYRYITQAGDALLMSPSIYIETIAAGGGSICGFDGMKLTVGPKSGSAFPGPACYGNGGPLTITDINLLLGRINTKKFRIPLNKVASGKALQELKDRHKDLGKISDEEILSGFIRIANEKMAEAIHKISVSKGYDPSEYAMLAFGGAGGLHACDIAQFIGSKNIIIPYDAGILSAVGIGHAATEVFENKQVLKPLNSCKDLLKDWFEDLENNARKRLQKALHSEMVEYTVRKKVFARYAGQDVPLELNIE